MTMRDECPVLTLYADNLDETTIPDLTPRRGARAVIVDDGQVLLVHLEKINTYTLPGGGIEEGESPYEALIREVKEETGLHVRSARKTLILKEHFPDSIWHHHFFRVEIDKAVPKTSPALTQMETDYGFETFFRPLDEALKILTENKSDHPHGANIQNRELLGLIHSV